LKKALFIWEQRSFIVYFIQSIGQMAMQLNQ